MQSQLPEVSPTREDTSPDLLNSLQGSQVESSELKSALLAASSTMDKTESDSPTLKNKRKLRHRLSVLFDEEKSPGIKKKKNERKSSLINMTPMADLQKKIDKKFTEQVEKEDSFQQVSKPKPKKKHFFLFQSASTKPKPELEHEPSEDEEDTIEETIDEDEDEEAIQKKTVKVLRDKSRKAQANEQLLANRIAILGHEQQRLLKKISKAKLQTEKLMKVKQLAEERHKRLDEVREIKQREVEERKQEVQFIRMQRNSKINEKLTQQAEALKEHGKEGYLAKHFYTQLKYQQQEQEIQENQRRREAVKEQEERIRQTISIEREKKMARSKQNYQEKKKIAEQRLENNNRSLSRLEAKEAELIAAVQQTQVMEKQTVEKLESVIGNNINSHQSRLEGKKEFNRELRQTYKKPPVLERPQAYGRAGPVVNFASSLQTSLGSSMPYSRQPSKLHHHESVSPEITNQNDLVDFSHSMVNPLNKVRSSNDHFTFQHRKSSLGTLNPTASTKLTETSPVGRSQPYHVFVKNKFVPVNRQANVQSVTNLVSSSSALEMPGRFDFMRPQHQLGFSTTKLEGNGSHLVVPRIDPPGRRNEKFSIQQQINFRRQKIQQAKEVYGIDVTVEDFARRHHIALPLKQNKPNKFKARRVYSKDREDKSELVSVLNGGESSLQPSASKRSRNEGFSSALHERPSKLAVTHDSKRVIGCLSTIGDERALPTEAHNTLDRQQPRKSRGKSYKQMGSMPRKLDEVISRKINVLKV